MTDLGVSWSAFRTALLRSAGFPFDWLKDLSSSELEDRSTRLVAAHAQRERARDEALDALWAMRGDPHPTDLTALNRAVRRVGKGQVVAESHTAIIEATLRWNDAVTHFDSLSHSTELSMILVAEYERAAGLLLKHFTSNYFKDAVLLSSPSMYEACCRASDGRGFRGSQRELAAYRFLQRFCAKNETGGAAGPLNLISVGVARADIVTSSDEYLRVDDPVLGRIEYAAAGDGRSAERRTFISYWAARELGRLLGSSAVGAPEHRRPFRLFGAPTPELAAVDARVLDRIDGRRSIRTLAAELDLPVETVTTSVSRLTDLALVEDNWRAPYFTRDAGEDLRIYAAGIDTPEARDVCQFIADVRSFAQAKLEDRPALMSAITHDFSRLTGKPAWRGPGRLKGDRAVFYEEARGNIRDARIGSAGARQLSERLSTALDFLASLAVEERAAGQLLLARELASRNVSELTAAEVRDMAAKAPLVPEHTTMRQRFLGLVDPSASCVDLSRADLADAGLIREDLDDWPIFGAADLMLTGPGGGESAGGASMILSELHHIWPPLASWVRALYDDRELGNQELWQTVAAELAPAVPTMQEIVRKGKATDSSPYGHTVLCLDTGLPLPDAVTVPADRIVVRRWQNGFIGLHDPASQRDLWLLPDYDDNGVDAGGLINCATPALSLSAFTLGPHTPRIVIDGVIVQRRRWEVSTAEIPSGSSRVPTDREWLALQVWRHEHGLPRRAYFWLDTERKPMFIDFSSVLSVSNFQRCLRPAQSVVLTEAQPDPEHLWLRTKDGTLTAEIRTLLWRDRRRASATAMVHTG
ncbi:lantibiotic biosynthesis dehydratase-like protein [Micromonospora sp. Llam0]|uniref:lantibiotic dehydratase n=1 Tax=Micromonospora sp. Llam0 TaxID=2485143 RepID=UPI000F4916AE|nr:lantibiotic dehydratase [Micromonospora sp. Llam0]ROO62634.1 lantibiotic biosynthesis dehydratase-like protein [Micromonospora sp. Llam0]